MFLTTYATCSMITLINFYQLIWTISTYINLLTLKSSAHVAWFSTARWNCSTNQRVLRRLPDEAAGRREAPGNLLGYLFGEFLFWVLIVRSYRFPKYMGIIPALFCF